MTLNGTSPPYPAYRRGAQPLQQLLWLSHGAHADLNMAAHRHNLTAHEAVELIMEDLAADNELAPALRRALQRAMERRALEQHSSIEGNGK